MRRLDGSSLVHALPYGLTIALTFGVGVAIYPQLPAYPYSDEWTYLTAIGQGYGTSVEWLLTPHIDHQIPIQKLLQIGIVAFSGGDFRTLVVANILVLGITSFIWLRIAAYARGGLNGLGDAVIPLLFLSPGFNTVTWGFSLQFIASVALSSAASLAWLRWPARGSSGLVPFALLSICAFTGANGVIASGVVGLAFLAEGALGRAGWLRRLSSILAIGVWALVVCGLVATYRPSGPSSVSFGSTTALPADFIAGLLKSWLGFYGATAGPAVSLLTFGLVVSAALAVARASRSVTQPLAAHAVRVSLLALLLSSVLTVLAIAAARSGLEAWFPGLETHYGYLVVAVPIACYLLIVNAAEWPRRAQVSIATVALCAVVFVNNYQWRLATLSSASSANAAADRSIRGGDSPDVVAGEFIRNFYYEDTASRRATVAFGIRTLRQLPFWMDGAQ